jgi:hypothetical protein
MNRDSGGSGSRPPRSSVSSTTGRMLHCSLAGPSPMAYIWRKLNVNYASQYRLRLIVAELTHPALAWLRRFPPALPARMLP